MDVVTFTELNREAKPFKPGSGYRYLDLGDNIEHAPPATTAFASIAGNHRAVEFLYGDATIPQYTAKPMSNDIECAKCHELKPRTAFTRDKRKRNGLASYCRACERGRKKVYRLRHAKWFDDTNDKNKRPVNLPKTG